MTRPAPFVLLVARHGATTERGAPSAFNRKDEDPPLTAEGHAQAERIAHLFGDKRPRLLQLYASPKRRAHETLAPLAARLALPRMTARELDELDYGRWAGVEKSLLAAEEPGPLWDWDRFGIEPPAGGFVPPAPAADAQVKRWAEARAVDGRPLLCVSHSGRLRSFYALAPDDGSRRAKMGVGRVGLLVRAHAGAAWERWLWDVPPQTLTACLAEHFGDTFYE